MSELVRVAVLGASGFVGSAICAALPRSVELRRVPAPRFRTPGRDVASLSEEALARAEVDELASALSGCRVVINAAGNPDASSRDADGLFGSNALLPKVILLAAERADVVRLVHVSSAVVQGDAPVLDASECMSPFSAYSTSKVVGEVLLRDATSPGPHVVCYRPPSVHAPGRRVSKQIAKLASSPLSTVAGDGSNPSPQALLENVAAAVAFLATFVGPVPAIVHHPWEGLSTKDVMTIFGQGREPKHVPVWAAGRAIAIAKGVGRRLPNLAANARRAELLWFGQRQADSWFTEVGWTPPVGIEGWERVACSTA